MLVDKRGRRINYLRVAVTDKCNLRCFYCMPERGVKYKPHSQILRFEEIIKIIRAGANLGINRVRITGGEPLVRRGIVDFIRSLKEIKEIEEISLTTNGVLLDDFLEDFVNAGVDRVNISLDTLQEEKYKRITRRDEFSRVWKGIESAIKSSMKTVKLNIVLIRGINDDEVYDFAELSLKYPLHIRFIELMPLGVSRKLNKTGYISLGEVKQRIEEKYSLVPVRVKGNGPAKYFRIPSAPGSIGFIMPLSHSFCSTCNRMRLTADGRLRPCLVDNREVILRRGGRIGSIKEIEKGFQLALEMKPERHYMNEKSLEKKMERDEREMYQIGG